MCSVYGGPIAGAICFFYLYLDNIDVRSEEDAVSDGGYPEVVDVLPPSSAFAHLNALDSLGLDNLSRRYQIDPDYFVFRSNYTRANDFYTYIHIYNIYTPCISHTSYMYYINMT